jgi:hypothetical protein
MNQNFYQTTRTLFLGAAVLCVSGSAFAQKVAAPPGFGPNVFSPTADTVVWSATTIEQTDLAGEPVPTWMGLWAYSSRHPMLTFDLTGQSAVQSATFYLYNYYYEGFALPGGNNVMGTATVRGIGGMTFAEPEVGWRLPTSDPTLTAGDTSWPTLGTFTITGSDGSATTPGDEVGWYAVDVTSLWNANVGSTLTLSVRFAATADGPIFEDRNGTAFAHQCYGAVADSGPRVVTVVPEPSSLLLLPLGSLILLSFRRK